MLIYVCRIVFGLGLEDLQYLSTASDDLFAPRRDHDIKDPCYLIHGFRIYL